MARTQRKAAEITAQRSLRKFIRKNIQPLDALLTQFGEFNVTVAGFADENTGRRLHVGTYAKLSLEERAKLDLPKSFQVAQKSATLPSTPYHGKRRVK